MVSLRFRYMCLAQNWEKGGGRGRGRKEEDPIQPPPFYHGSECSVEVCTAGTGSCLFPCSGCCTIIRLLLWLVARRHSSFRAHELADTGLCLEGRSEVLRTLRHCMPSIRAQELYQSRGGRPCGRKAALNPNCTDLNFAPKKGIGCGLCPPPPPPPPIPYRRTAVRTPCIDKVLFVAHSVNLTGLFQVHTWKTRHGS